MEHQGSTVVNASATSPEIRLRITDANGQDVQGTKLGEQLQLRIELKNEDSALDMQATHLMAMSGHTQQQIALIDSNGCPTDSVRMLQIDDRQFSRITSVDPGRRMMKALLLKWKSPR